MNIERKHEILKVTHLPDVLTDIISSYISPLFTHLEKNEEMISTCVEQNLDAEVLWLCNNDYDIEWAIDQALEMDNIVLASRLCRIYAKPIPVHIYQFICQHGNNKALTFILNTGGQYAWAGRINAGLALACKSSNPETTNILIEAGATHCAYCGGVEHDTIPNQFD
jgi:hypothetical protein